MAARAVPPGAIVVDGILDEAAWTESPGTDGFVQQTPDPGLPAVGATTVWVAHDDAALYVAARLDDPDPNLIQADERHRDAELSRSDAFAVLVDTYHDHQNGFLFETNLLAAQVDAIITREGVFINRAWDGLWDVAARRTPTGWAIEFRLPFDTLSFHPTASATWGIQFRRTIPHLRETSFWNRSRPNRPSTSCRARGIWRAWPPARAAGGSRSRRTSRAPTAQARRARRSGTSITTRAPISATGSRRTSRSI
jgi:hypothetical protein